MATLTTYLWVALGGAMGTVGRFWLSGWIAQKVPTFPLGTLVINVTGSFVIGLFAALTEPGGGFIVSPTFRTFFMIGICGGYTTFSSFSLQTLTLAQDGEWLYAGLNCVLSLALCLFAVWLGHTAGLFLQPK
ncbi:MAG: fluoride efflux transporter CrcB [Verrucomicrobium sp.]|nr:fluoride efflux transporter CrcB [Verrucomicrobium sp.]